MSGIGVGKAEAHTSQNLPPHSVDDPLSRDPEILQAPNAQVDIPDGGLEAWTVIFGGFLAYFGTFGVVNSYGVFQNYYQTTLLTNTSSSTISLIGAIQLFLMYGMSPIVGRIYDAYGTKFLFPIGTIITVFSLMMLSLCQEGQTYQFFLSQGILFGFGISLTFNPTLAVVGHWFRRRRGLAIGVVASGSSVGGVCYPIMLQRLIPEVGFPWAVRIAAFVTLAVMLGACFTIRTRLPLSGHISMRSAVDFGGFRDWRYALAGLGAFLVFYALFIPYFYIQVFADYEEVSNNISQYLLSIINATGVPARILPGYIADRLGVMNVLIPVTTFCGILILAVWLTARNAAAVVSFAAFYGLCTGAFVSLLPAYIATISPPEKFGARLGSIFLLVAIATLAGTPSAGGFLNVIDQSHFNNLIIFTGCVTLAGGVVLLFISLASRSRHPTPKY